MNEWINAKKQLPKVGIEVIGFAPNWIDEDFNPKGQRICFLNDEGEWTSAKWDNEQDHYHTHFAPICDNHERDDFEPMFWMETPKSPVKVYDSIVDGDPY